MRTMMAGGFCASVSGGVGKDDFNQIPELQVCIAEALYDAEAVLSNPSAFKAEEIRALRDQQGCWRVLWDSMTAQW